MKRVVSVLFFTLMLCIVAAQTSSSTNTNNPRGLTDAEIGLVPLTTNSAGQINVDPDIPDEALKEKAQKGDAPAQFYLGNYYKRATNYNAAVQWYQKSAQLGCAKAQIELGICYQDGDGVSQNYELAAKWFTRAAMQGEQSGQALLGVCYDNGIGVPENNVEAYKWLSLAISHEWGKLDAVRSNASVLLEDCRGHMSRDQIAEAQQLARKFVPRIEIAAINSASDLPFASGTGFFITDDGYLISNYHVVKDATKVRLLTGVGLIDASSVKVDAANDLALLKAVGAFKSLPIATSRMVKLGATVAAVGFPDIGSQGFAPKLAKGEIASLSGIQDDPRYFQISLPVQHGNSGGALVDVHGNVVGIVAARLGVEIGKAVTSDELPENVNYAVKSSLLLSFLESVPDVAAKLKEPNTKDEAFEEVVKSAQDAAVLVLVY